MINFKLYFKYILLNVNHLYFQYVVKKKNNNSIFIFSHTLYFLSLHFKLATPFYSTQLADIFAYEINLTMNNKIIKKNNENKTLIYNFHNILFDNRYFIFVINKEKNSSQLYSITEQFTNANWLEREVSELHGVFFEGKKDLRNLMLQYGDTSAPMLKCYPSIGEREIYFDAASDYLIQTPVSIQF